MPVVARRLAALAATGLLAASVAACGGSSASQSSAGGSSHPAVQSVPLKPGEDATKEQLLPGKRGGTLTVYSSEDFQHLDPAQSYFSLDYQPMYAMERPLFVFPPNNASTVAPDLATEIPTTANGGITDGGRTVTVHIQKGVRYAPPVNREVTSADVAFAIERGANPNVSSPYFPSYFGSAAPAPLRGMTAGYQGGPVPGITTPNQDTIVFHMSKPGAAYLVQALSLPLSSPVPPEFVRPLDKHSPTTFGTQYLTYTGPYMLKQNDKTGQFGGIGYQTGKSLNMVRNPNWDGNTYTAAYKPPADLDAINVNIGGDATVIGQQVLKGSHAVQLDTVAQSIIKLGYEQYPSQINFTPGAGDHYVAIDNHAGVFTNENLRKAFWANLNRAAIVKARGGSITAQPMTHFLYPGVNGFAQAGGYAGPQTDFNQNVSGDHAVACRYMKLAGYPNCTYTGPKTVQIVSASNGNTPAITQIVNSALTGLGFTTHVSEVDQSVMYTKYCQVPKQEIDACPSQGWIRDFADPLSVLYLPFYGPSITQQNNSNQGQVNDPQINAAIKAAAYVVDPAARAQAWANVDKMLVEKAVAVPEEYDSQANVRSADVQGVNDLWNEGTWDFAFTSLK
ncbi:MAG TPA: ABC transporter substrate-binding protein [Solirubrobacteraceae bacterium]|nr:ABC transporter substrate-binding protein [Solirubrobacteraceae bacterium]